MNSQLTRLSQLSVTFDGKNYPVESFADASAKLSHFRDAAGLGARDMASIGAFPLLIRDEAGKVVANVSYNGRVWDGKPRLSGSKMIYDPLITETK